MSVKVMSQVWEMDLPAPQKLVLLCLADHADEEGRNAYPGVARIERRTSLGERTVRRALADLRDAGHLEIEREYDVRSQLPRQYRVVTLTRAPANVTTPLVRAAPPSGQSGTRAGARAAPPSGQSGTLSVIEPSLEPPMNREEAPARQADAPRKRAEVARGWPEGFELTEPLRIYAQERDVDAEAEWEHFRAHHQSIGSRFVAWDRAWHTWVLRSAKMRPRVVAGGGPRRESAAERTDRMLREAASRPMVDPFEAFARATQAKATEARR